MPPLFPWFCIGSLNIWTKAGWGHGQCILLSKAFITQDILFMQLHLKKYNLSFTIFWEKWLLSYNENWWLIPDVNSFTVLEESCFRFIHAIMVGEDRSTVNNWLILLLVSKYTKKGTVSQHISKRSLFLKGESVCFNPMWDVCKWPDLSCLIMKTPERSRTSRAPILYSPFAPKSLFCYGLRDTNSSAVRVLTDTHRSNSMTLTADAGGKIADNIMWRNLFTPIYWF